MPLWKIIWSCSGVWQVLCACQLLVASALPLATVVGKYMPVNIYLSALTVITGVYTPRIHSAYTWGSRPSRPSVCQRCLCSCWSGASAYAGGSSQACPHCILWGNMVLPEIGVCCFQYGLPALCYKASKTRLFRAYPCESLSVGCVSVSRALQTTSMPQQHVERQRALKALMGSRRWTLQQAMVHSTCRCQRLISKRPGWHPVGRCMRSDPSSKMNTCQESKAQTSFCCDTLCEHDCLRTVQCNISYRHSLSVTALPNRAQRRS